MQTTIRMTLYAVLCGWLLLAGAGCSQLIDVEGIPEQQDQQDAAEPNNNTPPSPDTDPSPKDAPGPNDALAEDSQEEEEGLEDLPISPEDVPEEDTLGDDVADAADVPDSPEPQRARDGLIALYRFDNTFDPNEEAWSPVPNLADDAPANTSINTFRSGFQRLIDRDGIAFMANGGMIYASNSVPFARAISQSGAFSVELLFRTADQDQMGPARLLSYSRSATQQHILFGQRTIDGEYGVDVRHGFDSNLSDERFGGRLFANTLEPGPYHHILCVFDAASDQEEPLLRCHQNGDTEPTFRQAARSPFEWSDDDGFRLRFGNENGRGRTWRGEIYMAAIYDRALSTQEIEQNHQIAMAELPPELPIVSLTEVEIEDVPISQNDFPLILEMTPPIPGRRTLHFYAFEDDGDQRDMPMVPISVPAFFNDNGSAVVRMPFNNLDPDDETPIYFALISSDEYDSGAQWRTRVSFAESEE